LRTVGLASVLFFTVSGGPYGLETVVASLNAGWAVCLIILAAVVWALPSAAMVSELSTTLPLEGGYYIWVKKTLGPFWGLQEGWWSLWAIVADMAVYPVLFVNYLSYFVPYLSVGKDGDMDAHVALVRWSVALAVILVALIVNWQGARSVGHSALGSLFWVLGPFIALSIWRFAQPHSVTTALAAVKDGIKVPPTVRGLAVGLSAVLWNYTGWDNLSTFAEEVENPERTYPRAIWLTIPLILAVYLVPLLAGVGATTDREHWTSGWPDVAYVVGGRLLGDIVATAGLVSAWSLFNSQLLSVSRVPFVMAIDGWLPSALGRVSQRTAVPTTALVTTCVVISAFAVFSFEKLVVIDFLLYSAAFMLEFAALIELRRKAPDIVRPFKIPGGWPVIAAATAGPALCTIVVASVSAVDAFRDPLQVAIVSTALTSGILLYLIRRSKRGQLPS